MSKPTDFVNELKSRTRKFIDSVDTITFKDGADIPADWADFLMYGRGEVAEVVTEEVPTTDAEIEELLGEDYADEAADELDGTIL